MMDLELWFSQVSIMSPLAFALVALAGLVMGVAPSSLPLYSVVVGYAARSASGQKEGGGDTRFKGLMLAAGFVLGMATVDAVMGALFGFIGYSLAKALTQYFALTNLFLALLLLVFGLALLRTIRIRFPLLKPVLRRADTFTGAYVLGIPFGFASCPACTPMILPILGAAAATGSPWLGAVLLFVFGLARGLPLLIIGAAAGMVQRLHRVALWIPRIERSCGVLLLAAALYFFIRAAVYAEFIPSYGFLL